MRDIIIINDDRFKSVFVSVNLTLELKKELNSKNALLAAVLKKSSSIYKTEKELETELARLYNTSIDVDVEKLDYIYNIRFGMEILNVDYIGKEAINKAVQILTGLIINPNIKDDLFNEQVFEREKQSLIEKINEEKDDKRKYALKELEKDMFKGTEYSEPSLGNAEVVKNITNSELVDHYYYVLNNSKVIVTASGNLNNMEDVPEKIHNIICEKCGKVNIKKEEKDDNINSQIFERVENQDIAQSVVCIGLKLKNASREDMFKLLLYSAIMGGTPASKLFQNVREKESLAYFAKSMYNRFKSAIYLYAGVDPKLQGKAKEVMLKQVEILKNGDITDIEFNAAKQSLISGYLEMEDNKTSAIKNMLNNELFFEKEISIKEIISSLEKLTKQDIIEIANRIRVTNIFLLGGKAND